LAGPSCDTPFWDEVDLLFSNNGNHGVCAFRRGDPLSYSATRGKRPLAGN